MYFFGGGSILFREGAILSIGSYVMFVAATQKDLVLGLYSLPLLAPSAFHFHRCST